MCSKEVEIEEEDSEEFEDIVVDNGFDNIRAGYASDSCPKIEIKTRTGPEDLAHLQDQRFGACQDKWKEIYDSVTDDVSNSAVLHLLARPHVDLKRNKEKALEVHMETYDVPAFGVQDASLMAMYATGRTNGIVIDAGTNTRVLPVQYGYGCVPLGSIFFGGDRFAEEARINRLPDGNVLTLEKTKSIDAYFCRATEENVFICAGKKNPIFPGLASVVGRTMKAMELDDEDPVRNESLSNVLLCGGSSRLAGMKDRLQRELDAFDGGRFKGIARVRSSGEFRMIQISENKNVTHASYLGGCMLLNVSTFKTGRLVTKAEYQESGVNAFGRVLS